MSLYRLQRPSRSFQGYRWNAARKIVVTDQMNKEVKDLITAKNAIEQEISDLTKAKATLEAEIKLMKEKVASFLNWGGSMVWRRFIIPKRVLWELSWRFILNSRQDGHGFGWHGPLLCWGSSYRFIGKWYCLENSEDRYDQWNCQIRFNRELRSGLD